MTTTNRPTPLRNLIGDVTASRGLLIGIVTALVSGGIVSASTGDLLKSLTGLIPGAMALVGTLLGAHGVATAGEQLVTPVSDPAAMVDAGDGRGPRLVPLVPAVAPVPPVAPVAPLTDDPSDPTTLS